MEEGGSEARCTVSCDVANAAAACQPNVHCGLVLIDEAESLFGTACALRTGSGTQGATCARDSDCSQNHICYDPAGGDDLQCIRFCDNPTEAGATNPDCTGGSVCFGPMLSLLDGRSFGLCVNL
jgi:hypothetical protein